MLVASVCLPPTDQATDNDGMMIMDRKFLLEKVAGLTSASYICGVLVM